MQRVWLFPESLTGAPEHIFHLHDVSETLLNPNMIEYEQAWVSVLDLIARNFEYIQILVAGEFTICFCNREDFMDIKLLVEVVITSTYKCFCLNEYWVELIHKVLVLR